MGFLLKFWKTEFKQSHHNKNMIHVHWWIWGYRQTIRQDWLVNKTIHDGKHCIVLNMNVKYCKDTNTNIGLLRFYWDILWT